MTQTLYLSYVLHSKPYKVPAQNYSDLFNEFTVMSSGYFLFLFTDYLDDPVMSDHAGWALVGLLAFNIIINGIQIIIMTGKHIVFKLKLFYLRWLFKRLTK